MPLSPGASVTAFAPATTSNLGPGFDVLGLALDGPGDTVTATLSPTPGVRIVSIAGDGGALPLDPQQHTAAVAAAATLALAAVALGVELELSKGLPIGSGLGSSAASAAAAAFATNLLIGGPLRKRELIEPCLDAEAVVAGRHADNVAPALLGGLILGRRTDPLDLIRLPVPPGLWVGLVTPAFELQTRVARAALPEAIELAAMVRQSADLAALVSACHTGDLALLSRCVVDEVVAPRRAALIPGCGEVIAAAERAGALGSTVSGAGPTVLALCRSRSNAIEVTAAMAAAFEASGLSSTSFVSTADCPGARRR